MYLSPKSLSEFKQEIIKFRKVVDAIAEVWRSDKMTMITVFLQNLAFSGTGSIGYTHNGESDRIDQIIYALRTLAEYDKHDHTTNYIANEITMIYEGCLYSQNYEEMMDEEEKRGEGSMDTYTIDDIF